MKRHKFSDNVMRYARVAPLPKKRSFWDAEKGQVLQDWIVDAIYLTLIIWVPIVLFVIMVYIGDFAVQLFK